MPIWRSARAAALPPSISASASSSSQMTAQAKNFIEGMLGEVNPAFDYIDLPNTMKLDTIKLSRFYVRVTVKDNDAGFTSPNIPSIKFFVCAVI